ncbi:MAG TPA: site-2 protease family protein, partial [Candidatus Limnocylindria bacterium]|nr:site-2 protease family protein [Candidatus Limnocylindria bacterium]
MEEIIRQIAIWAPPVIVAVVLHEISHGWVANRLGDPTAARLGRLTLNPIAHVDLIGTIVVPLTLVVAGSPFVFGYAKPVPVNFHNLRNPKRDMVWVALAGPATNLALALAFTVIWKSLMPLSGDGKSGFDFMSVLVLIAQAGILINIALAVFNLLSLPPL